MGSYIDNASVTDRLRDDFSALYSLPKEKDDLATDITSIEATINSYVGARYQVPVTDGTAITVLKALSLDLFAELAWDRAAGDEIPKKVKERADVARTQLKAMAEGTMTLAGAEALTERPSGGAESIIVDGNTPEFDRDNMEGF